MIRFILVALSVLIAEPAFSEQLFQCPREIEFSKSRNHVDGSLAPPLQKSAVHTLDELGFYSSLDPFRGFLKFNELRNSDTGRVYTYLFTDKVKDESIIFACRYKDTEFEIVKPLDSRITRCTVTNPGSEDASVECN